MSETYSPVVLVIEDEPAIRRLLRDTLRGAARSVIEARSATEGLLSARDGSPDLVILDLGLPDTDGIHFIAQYRRWSRRPILVLSARRDESDKVQALDAGADDFLTKPFSVAELLARLRALARRDELSRSDETARFRFGSVEVDLAMSTVTRDGQAVHLSATEFRLLAVLLAQAGKVMTHRALLKAVWGPGHLDDSHYLRVYIGHLRQKLEQDPALPTHLLTEIGVGYRFVP